MNNHPTTASFHARSLDDAGFLIVGHRFGENHPPSARTIGSDPSWAATAGGDKFQITAVQQAIQERLAELLEGNP